MSDYLTSKQTGLYDVLLVSNDFLVYVRRDTYDIRLKQLWLWLIRGFSVNSVQRYAWVRFKRYEAFTGGVLKWKLSAGMIEYQRSFSLEVLY